MIGKSDNAGILLFSSFRKRNVYCLYVLLDVYMHLGLRTLESLKWHL